MPGPSVVLLRAQWRCEASDMALVCNQWPGGSAPLSFPGIWKRYRGPLKRDGLNVEIDTVSFLTTTRNPLVATINHERMPVLLTREEEFDTWLHGSADEALALVREYPPEQMRIVQEGFGKQDLLAAA